MERYRHGAGVVTYLARYLRGGPIKNARLVAYDGDRVTFTYRARQEEADAGPASSQRITLQTPPRHPCHQWELKLTGSSRGKSPLGTRHFLPYTRSMYYML